MTLRRSRIAEPRVLSRRYEDEDGVASGVRHWTTIQCADTTLPSPYQPHVPGRERFYRYVAELVIDFQAPTILVFTNQDKDRRKWSVNAAREYLATLGLRMNPVAHPGIKRALYIVHTRVVSTAGYQTLLRATERGGTFSMPVLFVDRLLQSADVQPRGDAISLSDWDDTSKLVPRTDGGINAALKLADLSREEKNYIKQELSKVRAAGSICIPSVGMSQCRDTNWKEVAMSLNRSKPVAVKVAGKRGRQSIPDMLAAIKPKSDVEKTFDNEAGAVAAMKRYSKVCTDEKLTGYTFGPSILPDEDEDGNPTGKYGFLISRA